MKQRPAVEIEDLRCHCWTCAFDTLGLRTCWLGIDTELPKLSGQLSKWISNHSLWSSLTSHVAIMFGAETYQVARLQHDTIWLTQLCNPTAYLNLPPTSFFRPCAKILFFQYPENFSAPTLKFRTWPFWGINGNGNHRVQTCETNIWGIFKLLALIHANKSTPSPNSWQGRIRI